jgi:hypothetical protein
MGAMSTNAVAICTHHIALLDFGFDFLQTITGNMIAAEIK